MPWTFPVALQSPVNRQVLACLVDHSAHSDVAEALAAALKPLGEVQRICPDRHRSACVLAVTCNVVFAAAFGMNTVGFRLDRRMRDRALVTGATPWAECGGDWVCFELFRDDWPRVDLEFWARKAYVAARELAG